jgi:hypothetical protein
MLSGVWNTNNAEAPQQGYVAKSDAKVLTGNATHNHFNLPTRWRPTCHLSTTDREQTLRVQTNTSKNQSTTTTWYSIPRCSFPNSEQ